MHDIVAQAAELLSSEQLVLVVASACGVLGPVLAVWVAWVLKGLDEHCSEQHVPGAGVGRPDDE